MSSSGTAMAVGADVRPFQYPAVAGVQSVESESLAGMSNESDASNREQGHREGEAQAQAQYAAAIELEQGRITHTIEEFAAERAHYYHQVEAEIVDLALSIARRVLHREADVDHALLAGLVRVAIDQLQDRTKIVLRVSPVEAAAWRAYLAAQPASIEPPLLLEDVGMPAGTCRLETALGATEIGIEPQLKEIERGLMDVLAQRPATRKLSRP